MPGPLDDCLRSLELSLRASRRSRHTIRQYVNSATLLYKHLAAEGEEDRFPAAVKRDDIRAMLVAWEDAGLRPASIAHRFGGLRGFFKFLEGEGELPKNPMTGVRPPMVPETQKDIVPAEVMGMALQRLDRAKQLRNAAILSLLYDTGMRATEVATLQRVNVDLSCDEYDGGAVIRLSNTKNHETRHVPISDATARRIDRYLRSRKDTSPWLFIAESGRTKGQPITRSGIFLVVRKVFKAENIEGIGPHDLRHTFATHFMEDESARTDDLMTIAGWRSPSMAARYTKSRKQARAVAAHRRLSPVGRL